MTLNTLASALGYADGPTRRLEQALTHRSWCNEQHLAAGGGAENNERLEFLGDAIVGLVVGEALLVAHPDAAEGVLSQLRAGIVNAKALAVVARKLGLGALLRLGRGEEVTGGREKDNLLADAFEAVIGAVYLDGGLAPARKVILDLVGGMVKNAALVEHRDWKTALQEVAQARFKRVPVYATVSQDGPDHEKTFVVDAMVVGHDHGRGRGRSKKAAEQDAARVLLGKLGKLGGM